MTVPAPGAIGGAALAGAISRLGLQTRFRATVREVNLELSNYCNRSCPYCPSRPVAKELIRALPAQVLSRVLDELAAIRFDGTINFNLYNEPLHDWPHLTSVLEEAAGRLPGASLSIFTNGDYLTPERLAWLVERRLAHLCVTLHYKENWNTEDESRRLLAFLDRYGLAGPTSRAPGLVQWSGRLGATEVRIHAPDFERYGTDRGGSLLSGVHRPTRQTPCSMPRWQLNVNYLGEVYPCCNVYPRAAVSGRYVLGDLTTQGLVETWGSERYQGFLAQVESMTGRPGDTPPCCLHCAESR